MSEDSDSELIPDLQDACLLELKALATSAYDQLYQKVGHLLPSTPNQALFGVLLKEWTIDDGSKYIPRQWTIPLLADFITKVSGLPRHSSKASDRHIPAQRASCPFCFGNSRDELDITYYYPDELLLTDGCNMIVGTPHHYWELSIPIEKVDDALALYIAARFANIYSHTNKCNYL